MATTAFGLGNVVEANGFGSATGAKKKGLEKRVDGSITCADNVHVSASDKPSRRNFVDDGRDGDQKSATKTGRSRSRSERVDDGRARRFGANDNRGDLAKGLLKVDLELKGENVGAVHCRHTGERIEPSLLCGASNSSVGNNTDAGHRQDDIAANLFDDNPGNGRARSGSAREHLLDANGTGIKVAGLDCAIDTKVLARSDRVAKKHGSPPALLVEPSDQSAGIAGNTRIAARARLAGSQQLALLKFEIGTSKGVTWALGRRAGLARFARFARFLRMFVFVTGHFVGC